MGSLAPPNCSPQELNALIHEASRHHNLPPALVKAVIRVESNFNPGATSPKGAQGLMQLMPKTAEELAVANPYDTRENVWAGTRYLFMMLKRFDNRLHLALAAYNAGPLRAEAAPGKEERQRSPETPASRGRAPEVPVEACPESQAWLPGCGRHA